MKKKTKMSSLIVTLLVIALCGVTVFALLRVPKSDPLPDITDAAAVSSAAKQGTTTAPSGSFDKAAAEKTADEIAALDKTLSKDILLYCAEKYNADTLSTVLSALKDKSYTPEMWYALTGNTWTVLGDLSSGKAEEDKNIHVIEGGEKGAVEIGFVGDINLADDWSLMQHCNEAGGLSKCLSPELIKMMNGADIMFANNECTYSTRGTAQSGKSYTFRADPKNVKLLGDLGIDIVSTANNHIYDYGTEAFNDTFKTLDGAGIAHVGAGKNTKEASQAQYFIVNGRKIAFVSAGDAYSWYRTPGATDSKEGILPAETKEYMVAAVKAAAAESDYVFAYLHWGYENNNWYSDEQVEFGRAFIDAGAAAVVGSHPHVLQGMDFYKDSLIAYSLGNFWFNTKTMDTGLLKFTIDEGGNITPTFVPCVQSGGNTTMKTEAKDKEDTFYFIESHSRNWGIDILDDGTVTAAK